MQARGTGPAPAVGMVARDAFKKKSPLEHRRACFVGETNLVLESRASKLLVLA